MKKLISILLAIMMLGALTCAASADEVPQPEAGKKFESDWAIAGGLAQIVYEEEGYRVMLDIAKDDGTGSTWEYSCYYQEDKDCLSSVSSSRTDYRLDPDTGDKIYGEAVYEGLDEEKVTEWKNEAAETDAEFRWNGGTADDMFYTVYILRGKTDGDTYASFLMNGTYDPATGKLTAEGTCTVFKKNAEGEYVSEEDGETYDAVFSRMEDGRVLFETDNGIELEYDMMGTQG